MPDDRQPDGLAPEDELTKSRLPLLTAARRSMRKERRPLLPHPGSSAPSESGAGAGRSGALRAAIFGANDGLVSNTSLIFGVAGAGVSNDLILIAGIAGLLAGASSMAAGEYISMRVQREVLERLIHLEAHELGSDPEGEREELTQIYMRKGVSEDLARRLAEELMRDPKTALDTHAREELGLDPEEGLGSPVAAAGWSFVTFAIGALLPLVPFLFSEGRPAVFATAIVAGAALFGIGASMSVLTGRSWLMSGSRMLAIGSAAAIATYLIGALFGVATA